MRAAVRHQMAAGYSCRTARVTEAWLCGVKGRCRCVHAHGVALRRHRAASPGTVHTGEATPRVGEGEGRGAGRQRKAVE